MGAAYDIHQRAAALHAEAGILRAAGADDTADVLHARKRALCPAFAHNIVRVTRNAAHVVAALAHRGAVALAAADNAQRRAAADRTHVVTLADDRTAVGTFLQNALELIAPAKGRGHRILVVLRIQLVVDHHRAGDAAHVNVAADGAGVAAQQHLAADHGVKVLVGGVLDHGAGRHALHVFDHVEQRVHQRCELPVDLPHILKHCV